ncbi:ubiquitinyl hydrolase [Aureococcus anophagefferens]|nr:ubiquitinyl hydrolase [Aureococcus anophagefferens]
MTNALVFPERLCFVKGPQSRSGHGCLRDGKVEDWLGLFYDLGAWCSFETKTLRGLNLITAPGKFISGGEAAIARKMQDQKYAALRAERGGLRAEPNEFGGTSRRRTRREQDLLGGLDLVETLLAARGTPATAVAVLPHLRCVLKAARTPRRALARTEKLLRAILASFPGIRKDHHDFFRFLRPDAAKDGAAARGRGGPRRRRSGAGRPPGCGTSATRATSTRASGRSTRRRPCGGCCSAARRRATGGRRARPDASKRPLGALPRVTPRLREALALLEGSDRPGLALRSLRGSFRAPYDGADQQDAAEFLHYVLDALEDEADLGGPAVVGDAAKRAAATRELDAVFGGVLETSIECERCGAVSTTRHGVCGKLDVCVPDDGAPRKNEVGCAPREPAAKPASLQDLVRDQYLAEEVLEGDSAGRRGVAYALYAVVVHAGASPHHGHYYAYATDSDVAASERPPAWSLFDDMDVRPVDAAAPSTPRSAAASPYVLFYARIGGGCPRAGGAPAWRAGLRAFVDADNAAYGRGGDGDEPGPAPGPPPPPRGGAGGAEPFAGAARSGAGA